MPTNIIPGAQKWEVVRTDEIIYCKADGNYSIIYLTGNSKIISAVKLCQLEEQICCKRFFRVHKSFLVNLFFVRSVINVRRKVLLRTGGELPVSKRKLKPLKQRLNELNNLDTGT